MKIFISGQLGQAGEISELFVRAQNQGHIITHDWTASDVFLSSREQKLANKKEAGRRAQSDIEGVVNADVYVLMSNNQTKGTGMYVELGAALALRHISDISPRIFVVGPLNHLSIFYLHPFIEHRATFDEVLIELSEP